MRRSTLKTISGSIWSITLVLTFIVFTVGLILDSLLLIVIFGFLLLSDMCYLFIIVSYWDWYRSLIEQSYNFIFQKHSSTRR